MNAEELAKLSPMILGWVTALIGWIVGIVQWRKKRKAEAELRLIRRRGEAPFLAPSNAVFDMLYTSLKGNELRGFQAGNANVLCIHRDEVDRNLPEGNPVFLVLEVSGQSARRVTVLLDGAPVEVRQEPEIRDAHGLHFIEYPYQPAKHGQEQRLVIEFETTGGVQDRHSYLLKHGCRELKRIDPA